MRPTARCCREGWRKLLPRAIADPLNPHSWRADAAMACPPPEMPQAPAQRRLGPA